MSNHFTKVTIIVENDDSTTTYKIPMATDVSFETNAIEKLGPTLGGKQFYEGMLDLNLSLTAFFDSKRDHIWVEEVKTMGKDVSK